MTYRRSTIPRVVLVTVFLAMIAAPALCTLLDPVAEVSETEQRQLTGFPDFSWNPKRIRRYPQRFEAWWNDHFGFRPALIGAFNRVRVHALKVSSNDRVIVGRDGWLFLSGEEHLRNYRNDWPYSDNDLRRWGRMLIKKRDWLAERDIDYAIAFIPNKMTVYPEARPAWLRPVRDKSRLDQLVEYLAEHTDVAVLDMRDALQDAARDLRVYQRTDTHWNAWGAYVGTTVLLDQVRRWFPEFRPALTLEADDFMTRRGRAGDLANMLEMRDAMYEDHIEPRQLPEPCAHLVGFDRPPDTRQMIQETFAMECGRAKLRAVIFRDSYIMAQLPFLADNFRRSVYVPAAPISFRHMQEFVEQEKPDLVIEQRVERWLRGPEG